MSFISVYTHLFFWALCVLLHVLHFSNRLHVSCSKVVILKGRYLCRKKTVLWAFLKGSK